MIRLAGAVLLAGTALLTPQGPERHIVTVSAQGFEPKTLQAMKGDVIVIEVRSAGGEHCFAIDALRVEKRVTTERPAVVEITLAEAGRFRFHCCLETGRAAEMERGELVVRQ